MKKKKTHSVCERELERESSEEGVTDTLSGCNYNWTGEREKCDVETNKGIKKKSIKTKWFIYLQERKE